jgi:Spy/CpxP family protein refolding chaperone
MYHRIVILSGVFIANIVFLCCLNAQVPADHDALQAGEGMGLAAYAEANGYPGPKHVLDLAKDLEISPPQKKAIQDIYDQTKLRAKELGERIISVEEELNDAFKGGLASDKSVREIVDQIETLRAKLRTLHLVAHLKTKSFLSGDQLVVYKRLRLSASKNGH